MDNDFLHDLFAEFGAIDIRRMFSGRGIYAGGVIFGIVSRDGAIHFKTDETTREAYARENTVPLSFTKKNGQRMVTSYWRLPERLYDDPGELAEWAREAVRVAQASSAAKKPARTARQKPAIKTAKMKAERVSRKKLKKPVTKRAPRRKRRV